MGHFTLVKFFWPSRGSNQNLLHANPTLYRVAIKAVLYRKTAVLYRKTIQVCIIPSTITHAHRGVLIAAGNRETAIPGFSPMNFLNTYLPYRK